MTTHIRKLIEQHREGMRYFNELGAYIASHTERPHTMQGLAGTTVYDEMGNVVYTDFGDEMPTANGEQAPLTHAQTDTGTFSEAFPRTYETVQDALSVPGNVIDAAGNVWNEAGEMIGKVASGAKTVAIWAAVIIAIVVLAPPVLNYMSSRRK